MLVQKGRIALGDDVGRWISRALALPGIALAPLEAPISVGSVRLPGDFHADPADRMIVATARFHQAPLMTANQAILTYGARVMSVRLPPRHDPESVYWLWVWLCSCCSTVTATFRASLAEP
jgi:hypothetical protein